jgi:hypothetical protein
MVILWFDTEDYLLPASDDAARRVAEILTARGIRGTFKVVGRRPASSSGARAPT